MKIKVGFIGSGNLAQSLIHGLSAQQKFELYVSSPHIFADDKNVGQAHKVAQNSEVVKKVSMIVLAVKPNQITAVSSEIAPLVQSHHSVISLAAGVKLTTISQLFGEHPCVFRCMPNIAAKMGLSTNVLFAKPDCPQATRERVNELFDIVGENTWVDSDALLDAATALVGSTPAMLLNILDAISQTAIDIGFNEQDALSLSKQTAFGLISLAKSSEHSFAELISTITSKGGTTRALLNSLEKNDITAIIKQAIISAYERAQEIAQEN